MSGNPAGYCTRRFLATPLHEIIVLGIHSLDEGRLRSRVQRDGWVTDLAMDARSNIENGLPGRHLTAGPSCAPAGLSLGKTFKKTPYAAGLQPGGRDVAKDMREIAGIPLLMKTLLENGHGDCITVPGRTIAENLKSARSNPHRDVVRPARDGALVEAAVMSNLDVTEQVRCLPEGKAIGCPSGLLQDGDIRWADADSADSEALNVKLTGAEPAWRRTKWKLRETNHRSGALWTYAQEVGPAVGGAVTHPGGAHEKQCYADI